MKVLDHIIEQAQRQPRHIVLCEGEDKRVLQAAIRASTEGIATITIVGNHDRIQQCAQQEGLDVSAVALIDPATSPLTASFADTLYTLRSAKGMSREAAAANVLKPLCFANMMVRNGLADGSVAGAVHATADVVRNALQIIGKAPGQALVSSFFLMMLCQPHHPRHGGMIFSDCGLVVSPDQDELASIAIAAADSARMLLNEEPRVAMLSFSTAGSAKHAAVTKVIEAARRVKALRPDLAIDEDVQLDTAIVAEIAARKLPASATQGNANVLVFPSLEAGNIGYKLAERLGGAIAIGPLLQGLNKPANDLSRGCSSNDIFHVIGVTVVQAQYSQ